MIILNIQFQIGDYYLHQTVMLRLKNKMVTTSVYDDLNKQQHNLKNNRNRL